MWIVNNNQGILQLFSRMNGNRTNANNPFGNTASSRHFGIGGRNTLVDLLSGHYKNSYGVEGMCVTGRSNYKKIIPVSDEMKQHVLEDVKRAYYKFKEGYSCYKSGSAWLDFWKTYFGRIAG